MASETIQTNISFASWIFVSLAFLVIGYRASISIENAAMNTWSEAIAIQLISDATMVQEYDVTVPFRFSSPLGNLRPTIQLDGLSITIRIGSHRVEYTSKVSLYKAALLPDTDYVLQGSESQVDVRWTHS